MCEENGCTSVGKKLLVSGDECCGKTSLLFTYSKKKFPNTERLAYENYSTDVEVNGKLVKLELWDNACQDHYSQIRSLNYPDTDLVLFCFSIDNPNSLDNIKKKWLPELRLYCADVPFIVIGNKSDLRANSTLGRVSVTFEQGKKLAEEIGALAYFECSAKFQEGIKEVFETAAKLVLQVEEK